MCHSPFSPPPAVAALIVSRDLRPYAATDPVVTSGSAILPRVNRSPAPTLDCERPAAWRGSSRVDRPRQLLRGCFGGRLARRFCHAASFAEPIGKSRFHLYALALALADNGRRVLGEVRGQPD